MRYKVFTLRVKFERQTQKAYEFNSLEIVEYINLKSEWREMPEWLK